MVVFFVAGSAADAEFARVSHVNTCTPTHTSTHSLHTSSYYFFLLPSFCAPLLLYCITNNPPSTLTMLSLPLSLPPYLRSASAWSTSSSR